ncbi:malto-oligosyltrehalose trehalohydrolase [Microcoleus sp. FACHB-672]|uniref:malto-oligosyltrehalose trehalohydrolase n=1 Tax=Microcoleus sp. FACHB-672 TaxID=2692825 RepID=UPI0016822496|nr:malto-oligosyltrehalose trehalohydrolase [Microcoleus sp. FACHB-672]MBD2041277.1 malto-oligosyltrehalose trehalohydrolase [Microcoleus sp. FACHB-672]
MKNGAYYLGEGRCEFRVWAPTLKEVAVHIVSPDDRLLSMEQDEQGYWKVTAENINSGTLYFYKLNGKNDRPDPASDFQPKGVHGPSQVIDRNNFAWNDTNWSGIPIEEIIIYELHVGTFTDEGTFEAMIPRLKDLVELGVNAIEIMPVAQFPGERNWGYDGVFPYAVQNSYGGPEGLKKLVNACHQEGISVILDVVYNHLGPEGNYFPEFGPYFTDKYRPVWGEALNFDDQYSDEVRDFFLNNALYWFENYHIDALRLDAIQAIFEVGARPFLQELATATDSLSQQLGRKLYLIAESDLNDVRVLRPKELGGFALDAQWCDDFHHSLHALLTGESDRYYQDFGKCEHLEKAFKESFVYSGQYAPHRKRKHGNSAKDQPGEQFVVFSQTHDQIGNRILGDRLSKLLSFEGVKLAAGIVLISPYIPFLFMGEEYGEEAPFLYFVSHSEEPLIEAIRKDKQNEFKAFEGRGEFQDPQSPETFQNCKLNWEKKQEGEHKALWGWYQRLIQLRRTIPALKKLDKESLEVSSIEEEKIIFLRRWSEDSQIFCIMNFNHKDVTCPVNIPAGNWQKILDSSETEWMGAGSTLPDSIESAQKLTVNSQSFTLYEIKS